jgi:hypothetical protein
MNKRELVRYICSGGLRMYDDECSVRWANMPEEERADWLVFFDMCRDEPSPHTEEVIQAIMAGLCPEKKIVHWGGMPPGEIPPTGHGKAWLFRASEGFGPATVRATLTEPFTHYYFAPSGWAAKKGHCGLTAEVPERREWWFRHRAIPAFAFKHPAHAWAFLLSFL